MTEINYPESNDGRMRVRKLEDGQDAERIADLKRQLEAERQARVWHAQSEMDAQKRYGAARYLADKEIERAERNRKISLNRLRRLKKAESELQDALRRINRLKFELAHAGGEMPEGE